MHRTIVAMFFLLATSSFGKMPLAQVQQVSNTEHMSRRLDESHFSKTFVTGPRLDLHSSTHYPDDMDASVLVSEFLAQSPSRAPALAVELLQIMGAYNISQLTELNNSERRNRLHSQLFRQMRSFVLTFAEYVTISSDASLLRYVRDSVRKLSLQPNFNFSARDLNSEDLPVVRRGGDSRDAVVPPQAPESIDSNGRSYEHLLGLNTTVSTVTRSNQQAHGTCDRALDIDISREGRRLDQVQGQIPNNIDSHGARVGARTSESLRGGTATETDSGCGGPRVLTSQTGLITDGSGDGIDYESNTDCRWTIEPSSGSDDSLEIRSVFVTVSALDTEKGYDFLSFQSSWKISQYSGNYESASGLHCTGSACELQTSTSILHFSVPLYIAFSADASFNAGGFALEWVMSNQDPPAMGGVANATHSGCGGERVLTGQSGIITDGSGVGGGYLPFTDCKWTIGDVNAPLGATVAITISRLDIEPGPACSYDGLQFQGDWQDMRYCGNAGSSIQCHGILCATGMEDTVTKPPIKLMFASPLSISFITDASQSGDGFSVEWAIVSTPPPQMLRLPAAEQSALVDLYMATGGSNWTHNDGWRDHAAEADPSNPTCEWYGVTCTWVQMPREVSIGGYDIVEHLTQLLLFNNGLRGSIPESFGAFSLLHTLDMDKNALQSLPRSISSLASLRVLVLADNVLRSLPDTIGGLTSLTTLELNGNKLQSLPHSIGDLTSLRTLDISDNELRSLPGSIAGLISLIGLFLRQNKLQSLPHSIGDLTSLQTLDISDNELRSLPDTIGRLTSLFSLTINHNKALRRLPESIGDLGSLVILDLQANALQNLPESIGNCTALMFIFLNNNEVRSLPESITGLPSLSGLYIQDNKLEFLPESFGSLTSLTALLLGVNKLQSLPRSFGNFKSLRFVYLNTNELRSLPDTIGGLTSLTTLELNGNKLQSLPDSIGELTSLVTLHMNGNELHNLPSSIGNLGSLRHLRVSSNHIAALPESFSNLTELRDLRLYSNNVQVISPFLRRMDKLETLWVYSNRITNLDIPNFPDLTSVRAQDNAITQLSFVPISDGNDDDGPDPLLPALTELIVHHNELTTFPPSVWELTTSLVTLDLSHNKLTGTVSPSVGAMLKLERLQLDHNSITAVPTELGNLGGTLTQLSLRNNQISGTIPTEFVSLEKLQAVDLSNNRFSGTVPDAILGELSRVTKFDVSGNNLTGVLPMGIERAPLLSTIILSSNPWNVDLASFLYPLLRRFMAVDGSTQGRGGGCNMGPLLGFDNDYEFAPCLVITIIEIDNTLLAGTIPAALIAINETEVLSLRSNVRLEGPLPQAATEVHTSTQQGLTRTLPPPLWGSIDVSGCTGLSGSIPISWERITTLSRMNISNTSMRGDGDGAENVGNQGNGAVSAWDMGIAMLPSFVKMTGSFRVYERSAMIVVADNGDVTREIVSERPVKCPLLGKDNGMQLEVDPDYYGWGICTCQNGDVGGGGQCGECVLGGDCDDGSAFRNKAGWWCSQHTDDISHPNCYLCPSGVCPASAVSEQCNEIGRQGSLCGACKEGHSATFGGVRCVPDEDCQSGATWLFAAVVVGAGVFVITLVVMFRPYNVKNGKHAKRANVTAAAAAFALRGRCLRALSNGKSALVLYYQLLPFVSEGLSQLLKDAGVLERVIAAIFSLDADAAGASGGGGDGSLAVCAVRGLTPLSKVTLGYIVPAIALSWVGMSMLAMRVAVKLRPTLKTRPPCGWLRWYDGPASALFACCMLAYSNVLKTSMQLLRCVDVEGEYVLFLAGTVPCGQNWQSGLYAIIVLLAIAPVALAVWARRQQEQFASPSYKTLLAPFSLWWWCGALLLQRLLVVSIAVFVAQPITRASWLFVACLAVLLWNIYWQPFRRAVVQLFNTLLLLGLALVAGLNAVVVALLLDQSESEMIGAAGFRAVTSCAYLLPVIVYGVACIAAVTLPLWPVSVLQRLSSFLSSLETRDQDARDATVTGHDAIETGGGAQGHGHDRGLAFEMAQRGCDQRVHDAMVTSPTRTVSLVTAAASTPDLLVEGEWTEPISEEALRSGDMAMC